MLEKGSYIDMVIWISINNGLIKDQL